MSETLNKNLRWVDRKLIISGTHAEYIHFSRPYLAGSGNRKPKALSGRQANDTAVEESTEAPKQDYRKEHLSKTKNLLTRLAHTNFDYDQATTFITLTYRNHKEVSQAKKHFAGFAREVGRILKKFDMPKLKYIYKIEFQENGNVHFHVLTNLRGFPWSESVATKWMNGGTLPEGWRKNYNLRSIWLNKSDGNGGVDAQVLKECADKNPRDIAISYLSKYMTKEDDDRLRDERAWERSQGLKDSLVRENDKADKNRDKLLELGAEQIGYWQGTPERFKSAYPELDLVITKTIFKIPAWFDKKKQIEGTKLPLIK